MINLVQSPFGREIPNVDLDTFTRGFNGYVKRELLEFMLKDEETVEVTYIPEEKTCRFDFVDVKSILKQDILNGFDEDVNHLLNIDVNLNEGKLKLYVVLNKIEDLIKDLHDEERNKVISEYVTLKSDLKKIDFYLEIDDITGVSLVSNNLKSLTVDELSKAINIAEDFRKSVAKHYLEF